MVSSGSGGSGRPVVKSALPARRLCSRPVQDCLTTHLVQPAFDRGLRVAAVRLSWLKQDDATTQSVWDQIVDWRPNLDAMVCQVPGVVMYISAITATQSTISGRKDKSAEYRIHPGIAYWVLADPIVFQERLLFSHLQKNRYGATMKPLLHPYQQTAQDITNAIFTVVKDNVEGVVTRMVVSSSALCCGPDQPMHPLVKLYVLNETESTFAQNLVDRLAEANFPVALEINV